MAQDVVKSDAMVKINALPTMKNLPAGSYSQLPAEMRHFAKARTAAVVQVHGIGPFALNYVNPADDPRTSAPAK